MKYLIIILILFSSLTIQGEKQNGITNRIYSRIESPFYRYFNKDGYTTVYWPNIDRFVGIQSMAKTSK